MMSGSSSNEGQQQRNKAAGAAGGFRKEAGTSIRSFDAFVSERRLLKTLPMSVMKGGTVGVDADHFVARVLNGPSKREPLVHAVGGFPNSVEAALDAFLAALKANGVAATFVLTGIDRPPETQQFNAALSAQRMHAWSLYDRGQGEQAVMAFDDAEPYDVRTGPGGRRMLLRALATRGVDFIVAPYRAGAQLAYMAAAGYVDAVYGSSDALLYGLERLITAVDLRNNNNSNNSNSSTFQWVTRRAVAGELGIPPGGAGESQQLVEAAVAAASFPPVEHMVQAQPAMGAPVTALRAVQDLAGAHGSVYAAVVAYPDNGGYGDRFRRECAAARYQPVLKEDGHVEPLDPEGDLPNDVHDVVGKRLPDEHLFYMSRGLVGTELLAALAHGVYIEEAPLDGGENPEYRAFVTGSLQDVRGKALNLLTQTMHRYYQYNQVRILYWFDPGTPRAFAKVVPPVYSSVSKRKLLFSSTNSQQTSEPHEVSAAPNFLRLLMGLSSGSMTTEEGKRQLEGDALVAGNAGFRAMQVLGLCDGSGASTGVGKALVAGGTGLSSDLADALVIAVLLVQASAFTSAASHTSLVARVGTLVGLRHNAIGFTGPLSRDLLAFHAFVTAEVQTCRWLVEAALVSLLCNEEADRTSRSDDEWTQLGLQLPFGSVPNAATGIAIKSYLDEVVHNNGDVNGAKNTVRGMFKHAVDVVGDVDRGFKLWDALVTAVRTLGPSTPAYQQFLDADAWLKNKR
ncbi:hypothetical protein TRICI_004360 [Trichomonascus ciferrii]|uniref:XPG-I domain-containing protein n=1 Tax=Trichomonascus ciferrii TaxID=44093 RepID=A0A642V135_9ASCO|nr:hypothetical protein TRICI_004360 [Trichomonascus ciferrii]